MANNVRNAAAVKEEKILNNEMITSKNLSMELLKEALKAAKMKIIEENDGSFFMVMGVPLVIEPDLKLKNRIRFSSALKFKDNHTVLGYLECVNLINVQSKDLRAFAFDPDDSHLGLSYDLTIDRGMTKKDFILAIRHFDKTARRVYIDNEHIVG